MLYSIINILTSLLNQLITLMLVYRLNSSEYGIYSLILVYGAALCLLCFQWNDILILNLGTKEVIYKGTIKNVLRTRTILIITSMTLVGLFFFGVKYFYQFDFNNIVNADLILLYFVAQLLYNFFSNVFFAKGFNNLQSILNIIPRIITVLYLFFYFVTIPEFLYCIFLINAVYFLICLGIYINEEYRVKIDFKFQDYKNHTMFAMMQSISIAGIYILNWGDNIALQFYNISLDEIGNYNFAYRIFLGFNVFFGLLNIIAPKVVHSYTKNGGGKSLRELLKFRIYFVYILAFLYIILVLLLRILLAYFSKISYLNSIGYMLLLFIPFLFMAYIDYIVPLVINTPFYKKIQTTTFKQAVINVVCNFIFMYFYGIYGVIIGTTLSYIYRVCVLEKLYRNEVKVYFKQFEKK